MDDERFVQKHCQQSYRTLEHIRKQTKVYCIIDRNARQCKRKIVHLLAVMDITGDNETIEARTTSNH